MSFESLKKNRLSVITKLITEAEKSGGGGGKGEDNRYWKPAVDKSGNGYAVLRFLPAKDETKVPWAQYWDHGFKGPTGRWYIEKSLTSIGQPDPVSELNSQLWNSGREEDKEIARARKRRLHYVSNVYIVADPANPQNEGKVFLFQYGKKIFNKIMDVMQPEFQDEKPVNPFDLWEGANFKLKIRQVEGYRNYDKSEFDSPSALLGGSDDKLKGIYESIHGLEEFTDPSQFKSYEQLSMKLREVIGTTENVKEAVKEAKLPTPKAPVADYDEDEEDSAPSKPAPNEKKIFNDEDEDEATMSFFERLAKD